MATIGVLLSTFTVGGAMWLGLDLLGLSVPFIWALLFGALISPTDPVAVLVWGGLRSGISVALAFSLPANEFKPLLLANTYGVVVFSIVVQGLTVRRVVEQVVQPPADAPAD